MYKNEAQTIHSISDPKFALRGYHASNPTQPILYIEGSTNENNVHKWSTKDLFYFQPHIRNGGWNMHLLEFICKK